MSGVTDNDSSTGSPEEATLPPYTSHPSTSTPRMVTHTYSLVHKKGHNWLTLNVQSRASSPDQFPAVIGDRPVQGNVVYDPKDQKDPKSITVKILGELVSESNIHFTFLEVSQELWPAPATHASGGPYTLPFSLQLPPTAEALNEEDKIETFKIPPTDFARIRRFTVVYTLQVKVKYSSMFRSTRMLDTSVNYTPLVQPPPPSVLRQNAYSANSPIPAPDVDPEGWHSLPSVTFEGKLFNDRVITFKYTLSLAKPLAYVRGSVVPLHLLVECSDADGLDLVSAPTAPVVRFKITSRANYDAGGINDPGTRKKLLELKTPRMSEFRGVVDWLNTAIWWSTPSDKANARTLQGEIHLRPSLRPSALLGRYRVWYDVAMLEPEVPGFVPTTPPKHKILQRVEVDIATVFPNGPRPIAYSPPVYKEDNVDDPEEGRATMYNTFK